MIEKDPAWSAYGVGIIQQGNVLRAVNALGLLDRYIDAGAGFDAVEVFIPNGMKVARVEAIRSRSIRCRSPYLPCSKGSAG